MNCPNYGKLTKAILYLLIFWNFTECLSQKLNIKQYSANEGLDNSGVLNIGFDSLANKMWLATRNHGVYNYSNHGFSIINKIDFKKPDIVNDENGKCYILESINNNIKLFDANSLQLLFETKIDLNITLSPVFRRSYIVKKKLYIFSYNIISILNLENSKDKILYIPVRQNINNAIVINNRIFINTDSEVFEVKENTVKLILNEKINSISIGNGNNIFIFLDNKVLAFDINTKAQKTLSKGNFTSLKGLNSCALKGAIIFYNLEYIYIVNTEDFKIKTINKNNGLLDDGAFFITTDRERNIWICSDNGISKWNNVEFACYSNKIFGFAGQEISCIAKSDKYYFLGSNYNFGLIDKEFNKKNTFLTLNNNDISRVLDANLNIKSEFDFVYSNGIGVLSELNFKQKQFQISNYFKQYSSVLHFKDYSVVSINSTLLYLNSSYKIINKYDVKGCQNIRKLFFKNDSTIVLVSESGVFETKIFSKVVNQIFNKSSYSYLFSNNISYIACYDGLYKIENGETSKIQLPLLANIKLYALTIDKYNRLWIGSNNGVFVLDLIKNKVLRINSFMNISGLEVNRSAFLIDGDFILVGTNSGLNKIPIDFEIPIYIPPTFIEKITCNKNNIGINKNKFLFNENNFTFTYGLNSNINEKENYFSYQLIGFDSAWNSNIKNFEVRYTNLKEGKYTFRVKGWNVFGQEAKIATFTFTIMPPWWRTWWFYALLVLVVLMSIYMLFKWRLKISKRKAETKQLLAESELKALRAQINPHYLSNSLVSLQKMVLKDNKELAFETLSQYGTVMRNILNNSETQFVTLKNEIDTINEYLKLEGFLHFSQPQFNVLYNSINELDLENIMVPSMLIQPFVENAIIHGLIPKKEEPKLLTIEFTYNNKILLCKIQDNGVGRKVKENTTRKSMGIKNVEDRFKLYSRLLNQKVNIEIIDLKNDDLKPIGTKVVLMLPYKLNDT